MLSRQKKVASDDVLENNHYNTKDSNEINTLHPGVYEGSLLKI